MTMKNKLYKHHKSKTAYYLRHFSLAFLGLFFVGSAVVVPTYISSIQNSQISAKAESENQLKEENNEKDTIQKEDIEAYHSSDR